ncbi:MAG: HD domain-containing protein [Oscillospiraceae bacterium]
MKLMKSSDVLHVIERTLDYVDPRLAGHGAGVSYIVMCVLRNLGTYEQKDIQEAMGLALMHDIGAYKTEEIDNLVFETAHVWEHAIYGALFLRTFSPLGSKASIVALHHLPYEEYPFINPPLKDDDLSGLICIADRAELYLRNHSIEECLAHLLKYKYTLFSPFWIDAFFAANEKENILSKIKTLSYREEAADYIANLHFTQDEKARYLSLIAYSIDFRSHFMVLHTVTTVSVSIVLAKLAHLDEENQRKIRFGALLHDIGKVATPVEILEKPGRLTNSEMEIMRKHVVLTKDIIDGYVAPDIVNIAVRHHEKLDGSGYPLGLNAEDLNTNERIVAVADVVSALIRKRSYKEAYDKENTIHIIKSMSDENKLCPVICKLVLDNFDFIIKESTEYGADITQKYESIQCEFKNALSQVHIHFEN